ncbi:MAG: site-2 protease family protein [Halobacteriales archaeon]|nr:site-2 protease family protein [Halobacteriales archaeon]
MSVLYWVLGGFVAYWAVVFALDQRGFFEKYNASAVGPLVMLRTLKGREFVDRIARPKRFWRIYGNIGVAAAAVVMVASFVLLLRIAHLSLFQTPEPSPITQPQNVLVIPGLNDFLPLSMAPERLSGLLIGIVVHEGGHGIFCRVGNMKISSMGAVMLAFIPFGAFVEPDEEDVENAKSADRTRMFAAGVMNNFVLAVVSFLLIVVLLTAFVQPLDGVGVQNVADNSLADGVVERGERIVAVDGETVETGADFFEATESAAETGVMALTVADGDSTREETIPFETQGVEVRNVVSDTPAEEAGMQDGDFITSIAGEPVVNVNDFRSAVDGFSPGDEAVIEVQRDGETVALDVTFGESPRIEGAFLGISYVTTAEQVGITPYDIDYPYSLLTSLNPVDWAISIYLPLGAILGLTPFFGFDGFVLNFYEIRGPLAVLGGVFWLVPNVLYWSAWVNFNLGLFNCIPALPLDGGHILKEGFKKALSPVSEGEARDKLAGTMAGAVAVAMFGSMVLMIVAPRVL